MQVWLTLNAVWLLPNVGVLSQSSLTLMDVLSFFHGSTEIKLKVDFTHLL